ncbi:MAG: recombination protein RecR [Pseudomonadaceae bacterium]|nr:recombination protein RecR [Pseudomonadaceae bacterium]
MALVPLPFERLIKRLARLPGLGPRSAQRAALHLLTRPQELADILHILSEVGEQICVCGICGNLGMAERCHICADGVRDGGIICVVEGVDDLWALERSGGYAGVYHVLGGVVNALEGVGPDQLRMKELVARVEAGGVNEVILALGASVDGQTTGHLLAERLKPYGVVVSTLAKGMPVGAEVDYLDEGTLSLALAGRKRVA